MNVWGKICKFIFACLLLFVLFLLVLHLFYYPHIFYRYMDHLSDPEACQIRVLELDFELGEEQREELAGLIKELKYSSAYGPCLLSENIFHGPAGATYTILASSPEGEPMLFYIQDYKTSKAGFSTKARHCQSVTG